MKKYNEILRDLREDLDLTQTNIASLLTTTQQHYSRYETGEYELPIRHLITLSDFYMVSVDYILGRTKYKDTLDSLNRQLTKDITVGELISDIFRLNEHSRLSVIEYVQLQKLKNSQIK
ncbi:MAG: helix-turn-helix transcriptional regulator [Clostridiales bacterium]|nr:helix-turn-helix transcriptional regulator [Clostridiales bacterium]